MDSREQIAADIRAWLEWQQYCGTDVWKVDNIAAWDMHEPDRVLPRVRPNPPRPSQPIPKKEEPTKRVAPKAPELSPQPPVKKNNVPLPSWWQSIYENRQKRASFDFSRIPTGGDGLQRAFAFRDKNCDSKMCKWGVGRFDAEVVVIEGHRKHLDSAGFKMLGDMRENVLRLSKNNLYWIPLKRSLGCGHCDSMAMGQLNAIQPKAILVLGFGPLELLTGRSSPPAPQVRMPSATRESLLQTLVSP